MSYYLMGEFYSPDEKETIISKLECELNRKDISMSSGRTYRTAVPKKLNSSVDLKECITRDAIYNQLTCYVQYDSDDAVYVSKVPDMIEMGVRERTPFNKYEVLYNFYEPRKRYFIWTSTGEYFADEWSESEEFAIEQLVQTQNACYVFDTVSHRTWKTGFKNQVSKSSYKLSDEPQVLVRYACTIR